MRGGSRPRATWLTQQNVLFALPVLVGLMTVLWLFTSGWRSEPDPGVVSGARRQKGPAKRTFRRPLGFKVVATHPHDPKRFTQGLLSHEGSLYESTGLYERSQLLQWDADTGVTSKQFDLDRHLFGEGLALIPSSSGTWPAPLDTLVQIMWRERVAIYYDRGTFKEKQRFSFDSDGWGLAYCAQQDRLIMTDSGSTLIYRHPQTFKMTKRSTVKDFDGSPLVGMNELEMVDGELWANIYASFGGQDRKGWNTRIARIDPENAKFLGWIEMAGITHRSLFYGAQGEVLNGIAWDAESHR